MEQKKSRTSNPVILILLVTLLIALAFLIYVLFEKQISELTVEILAAIIAVLLVVASVSITIHFQLESEMRREFNVELFKQKLSLYQRFIGSVTSADNDGHVTEEEMMQMLNLARLISLVGSKELVAAFKPYLSKVIETGEVLIFNEGSDADVSIDTEEDETKYPFANIVVKMRTDLSVVADRHIDNLVRELMLLAPEIDKRRQKRARGEL